MLVRQVVFPTGPERLWDELTQPQRLQGWFGARVEWDLRPGGRARFVDEDGTIRDGVVETVERGRRLRFRWWPEADAERAASQISYDLEAEGESTRLTVTEQRLPVGVDADTAAHPEGDAPRASASASASARAGAVARLGAVARVGAVAWSQERRWTDWDSRLFGCWASVGAPSLVRGRLG